MAAVLNHAVYLSGLHFMVGVLDTHYFIKPDLLEGDLGVVGHTVVGCVLDNGANMTLSQMMTVVGASLTSRCKTGLTSTSTTVSQRRRRNMCWRRPGTERWSSPGSYSTGGWREVPQTLDTKGMVSMCLMPFHLLRYSSFH